MSADFNFNAEPPVNREAFNAWHDSLGDEASRPNANVEDDGGLWINGSWSRIGDSLETYWPALKTWAENAGVKLTFHSGDYCPEGFERVPEEDHWAGVFR